MNKNFYKLYLEYLDFINMKLKPQSVKKIESRFDLYILPYFKTKNIDDISTKDYLEWQMKIDKKKLKCSYKETLHYAFSGFYSYLGLFYNIVPNIPKVVGNFKNDNIPEEMNFWTFQEFTQFINSFDEKDFVFKAYFIFLFNTGVREGEALALKFDDIRNNDVFICKTISKEYYNGARIVTTPKSHDSIRHLKLDNYTIDVINKLKKTYKKVFGKNFNDNFYLFGGNRPLAVTTIKRKKDHYVNISGVKNIRIHDFRHSHATFLLKKNVPIVEISRRLGHSDINMTIKTYSHLKNEYELETLNVFNSIYKC